MADILSDIPKDQYGFLFHYYRAEVYRETNWRTRLDVTTNWSIIVTAGIMSYVFSTPIASHIIILMNILVVLFFLYVESRRFRYYNILRRRVRIMEKHVFGNIIEQKAPTSIHWREKLAESLRDPVLPMSRLESIAWRLRRNYLFLFLFLYGAWVAKLTQVTQPAEDVLQIISQAQAGLVPGSIVVSTLTALLVSGIIIAFYIPRVSEIDDLP